MNSKPRYPGLWAGGPGRDVHDTTGSAGRRWGASVAKPIGMIRMLGPRDASRAVGPPNDRDVRAPTTRCRGEVSATAGRPTSGRRPTLLSDALNVWFETHRMEVDEARLVGVQRRGEIVGAWSGGPA